MAAPLFATLPLKVLSKTLSVPPLLIAPADDRLLLLMLLARTVSAAPLATIIALPPSGPTFPPLRVTPEISTLPPVILKMRLALLPLMRRLVLPGPAIVRFLSTTSSPPARVIVPTTPNAIVSPGAAVAMASRSEPGPLSPVLVTLRVAASATLPGTNMLARNPKTTINDTMRLVCKPRNCLSTTVSFTHSDPR